MENRQSKLVVSLNQFIQTRVQFSPSPHIKESPLRRFFYAKNPIIDKRLHYCYNTPTSTSVDILNKTGEYRTMKIIIGNLRDAWNNMSTSDKWIAGSMLVSYFFIFIFSFYPETGNSLFANLVTAYAIVTSYGMLILLMGQSLFQLISSKTFSQVAGNTILTFIVGAFAWCFGFGILVVIYSYLDPAASTDKVIEFSMISSVPLTIAGAIFTAMYLQYQAKQKK